MHGHDSNLYNQQLQIMHDVLNARISEYSNRKRALLQQNTANIIRHNNASTNST